MISWIITGLILIVCFALIGICLRMDSGKENTPEYEEIRNNRRRA